MGAPDKYMMVHIAATQAAIENGIVINLNAKAALE